MKQFPLSNTYNYIDNMNRTRILNKRTICEGYDYLSKIEPAFEKILIEKNFNIPTFERKEGFEGIICLITEQQLSVASAEAIFKRIKKLVCPFTPENFLKEEDEQLKNTGLSRQKVDYCNGIAKKIIDKELNLTLLKKKDDDEVIKELTKIKGIGEWTAKCYLMACLKRIDIWPSSDLGLIVAVQKIKNLKDRPDFLTLDKIANSWSPYRSIAALILWSIYDKN